MEPADVDHQWMSEALELARRGRGLVEPNPMVGCVLVHSGREIARGFHRRFGGKHAEIEALDACQEDPAGGTAYVTLEPCCHHGKTPPCTDRLIQAGIARVVIADVDPFSEVSGRGIRQLTDAGMAVEVGVGQREAQRLNAPYRKRIEQGRPWVIAKWAMTLDGKIASRSGDSKWISSTASRACGHRIRGRVDAILTGSQTVIRDDPRLTARPPGPRVATRVVVDSELKTPLSAGLVATAGETPVLFSVGPEVDESRVRRFTEAGCQILRNSGTDHHTRLRQLLDELGRRQMTNVLAEGGGGLLGGLLDIGEVDEVHVFAGCQILGGQAAVTPVAGTGRSTISEAVQLEHVTHEILDGDVYISGLVRGSF